MRTPKRTKQQMFYSIPLDGQPIYAKDSEGNIIYDTMPDGEQVARLVGETDETFSEPIEFYNSITGTLTEDELLAFGDLPGMKAKMTYKKGEFPFGVGTLIFFEEPEEVTEENADYQIIGIQDLGRHFYKALLVQNA